MPGSIPRTSSGTLPLFDISQPDIPNTRLPPALARPQLPKTLIPPEMSIIPCFGELRTAQKLLNGNGVIYVRCSDEKGCQLSRDTLVAMQKQSWDPDARIENNCTVIGIGGITRNNPMEGLYHILSAPQGQRLGAKFDPHKAVLDSSADVDISEFDFLFVSRMGLEDISVSRDSSVENFREHLRAVIEEAGGDPSIWYLHVAQDAPGQPPTELRAPFNISPFQPSSGHKKAISNEKQLRERMEWFDRKYWTNIPIPGRREHFSDGDKAMHR